MRVYKIMPYRFEPVHANIFFEQKTQLQLELMVSISVFCRQLVVHENIGQMYILISQVMRSPKSSQRLFITGANFIAIYPLDETLHIEYQWGAPGRSPVIKIYLQGTMNVSP